MANRLAINRPGFSSPILSEALIHNGLIYTSGKIGVDANTGVLVSDDVAEQTKAVLGLLESVLREAGSGLNKILKCNIYLTNINDFAAMNAIFSELGKGAKSHRKELTEVKMRTLLLLGGMTPDVTSLYYNIINKVVRIKLGDRASAPLYLYSANLEEMIQHAMKGDWDEFAKVYKKPIRSLSDRVDGIAICAILAHKVAKKLFDDSSAARVPLFHIADCLALHITNNHPSAKKLGLLGPKISMLDSDDPDFFVAMLQKAGFEILIPETSEDIEEVNRGMLQEVAKGVASVTDSTKNMFVQQAKTLIDRGAQGIILGSTDLGFVLRQEDVGDIPLFEPAAIHAQELGIWISRRDSVRTERIRPVSDAAPVTPDSTELNVGAVTSPSVTPRIHSVGLIDAGPPQTEHGVSRSAYASLDDLPPRAIGLALLDIYFERLYNATLLFNRTQLFESYLDGKLAAFATYAGYGDAWAESARREAWLLTDRPTVQVVQALSCLNLYWFATRDLGRARINAVMAYASATTFRSLNLSEDGISTKDELQLIERKHGCFWACWSTMCISSFPEAYAKNAWEEAYNVPLPVSSGGFASEGNVARRYCMNVEWKPEALNEEPYPPSSIMAEHMRLMGVWDKRESPDVTRILHLSSLAKEIYESSHFPAYVKANEGAGRDIARIDILSILETFWEHLEPMTRSLQQAAAQILGPIDLIDQNAAGAESRGIEVPMTGVNSPAREEDVITTTYIESPEYPIAQNSARAFTNADFGVTDRAMEHVTQSMDETSDWHHNNLFEWCQIEGLLDIGDDLLDIGASVDWNMDLDLLIGFSSQMA
ncbi:hypothetical protein LB504_006015 [Fusarium proliferatum]|nr:hypothetical protein LB504_006015 [Fusarium proliferatum]